MKKELITVLVLLLLGGLVAVLLITPLGFIILGGIRGEDFFDGKPSSYWSHELAGDEGFSAAYQELMDGRGAAVPVLIIIVKGDTPKARRAAAVILGQFGAESKPAIPTLVDSLKHTDAITRQAAAEALGLLGPQAREAAPALRESLKDPVADVRKAAGVALMHIESLPKPP